MFGHNTAYQPKHKHIIATIKHRDKIDDQSFFAAAGHGNFAVTERTKLAKTGLWNRTTVHAQ